MLLGGGLVLLSMTRLGRIKHSVYGVAIALLAWSPPRAAHAAQITFTGVCSDCQGNGVATLTVTGFHPASPFTLTLSNLVSVSYAGANLVSPLSLTRLRKGDSL